MNKLTRKAIVIGKKSALKNTEFLCRYFLHQPKTPARLLAIKTPK